MNQNTKIEIIDNTTASVDDRTRGIFPSIPGIINHNENDTSREVSVILDNKIVGFRANLKNRDLSKGKRK